jgi:predicted P-loop ATPase
MEQWNRLDQLLLNIDDPLAASFLPRYLIGAVARVMEPGCHMRQLPVLIGAQDIGKSETARALFGPAFFNDQLSSKLDVDDVTRLHRHWCTELGELDGITRRTDQEALKAFISRRVDVERRKYGRSEDEMPRRSVFWGTSNGAPLRDPTGSSRFVCIAVPNRDLPLERVQEHRQAIWARAVEQYRAQVQWFTDADDRQLIAERNAGFEQQDPWMETVRSFAEVKAFEGLLPLQANDVLDRLEIAVKDRNNANTTRVRQLLEQLGWNYGRKRSDTGQLRGFWPPQR